MTQSERGLWDVARDGLRHFGRLQRIESPIVCGVPDVAYALRPATCGWLELKEIESPRRASTPIRLPSLTRHQVNWLVDWYATGCNAHLLLQLDRHYCLLRPDAVELIYDRQLTRAEVLERSLVAEEGAFPVAQVVTALAREARRRLA